MNIQQYERRGLALYEELAEIVAGLLKHAITAEPGYRLQQIQSRAKSIASLSRRLEEIRQIETESIEAHHKDLAGCRVVFYTNNDVNQFLSSCLLCELFDIDWNRSKFHLPGPYPTSVAKLFQSYNYVVALKDDQTALPEYRKFVGLYCEVQIQTSLNHAWAEMAHDTIYKRPELQGFGTLALKTIEKRLEDAMSKHLLPAGYLFQQIAIDVQRLAEGKVLFDVGVLDTILEAENNNDRHEALIRLKDNVLPNYDDLLGLFPEIREKLKEAWLVAGETDNVSYETPFGGFEGIESYQVTGQIAEIIERYRYLDPDETYTFIRDLYVQTSDAKSLDQLLALAERLASHTLHIWQRLGPSVQVSLAESLSKEEDIASIAPLMIRISSKILRPEITGATARSNLVTFRRGVVVHSEALAKARRIVVEIISTYAESVAGNDDALRGAITVLFDSCRMPRNGSDSPKLATMILSDMAHAAHRVNRFAPLASLKARQNIESRLLQWWCRNRSLPEPLRAVPSVAAAHECLIRNMITLRETLNADEEFVAFKTIVRYKSVIPHQWEEKRLDYNRDQAVRDQKQDELADSITLDNWSIWKSRLSIAANVKSNYLTTFPPYDRFLRAIAARQPALAFELLSDRSILPDWTIIPIAHALLDGRLRDDVEALLGHWLSEGRFLRQIAGLAASGASVNAILISGVTAKAVSDADEDVCVQLIESATRGYANNPKFWRDEVFFPCLSVLKQACNYDWIVRSWYQPGGESLFADFTANQDRTVLEAMVNIGDIGYEAEQILTSIAAAEHQMVLDWFGRRISIAAQEASYNFDLIPFSFQSLHEALQPHLRDVLTSMREWFDRDDSQWELHFSEFLSRIYPNFEEPLPSMLLKFIDSAHAKDLAFIVSSLRGFDGKAELLPILRAILASDVASDDIEGTVLKVLRETGVMSGEFGAAQTYQTKAYLLRPWLDDANERVAAFAAREIRSLERVAALESRRAREKIAMSKLQYGEPLKADEAGQMDSASLDDGPT